MLKLYPLHRWTRWPDITELVQKQDPYIYSLDATTKLNLSFIEPFGGVEFRRPEYIKRLERLTDRYAPKYDAP